MAYKQGSANGFPALGPRCELQAFGSTVLVTTCSFCRSIRLASNPWSFAQELKLLNHLFSPMCRGKWYPHSQDSGALILNPVSLKGMPCFEHPKDHTCHELWLVREHLTGAEKSHFTWFTLFNPLVNPALEMVFISFVDERIEVKAFLSKATYLFSSEASIRISGLFNSKVLKQAGRYLCFFNVSLSLTITSGGM